MTFTPPEYEPGGDMITVDEVTSESEFVTLEGVWNALLEKNYWNGPFLAHEWFHCCLVAGFAQHKELYILVVRDGAEVIGIAPWWRYQDVVRGVPARKIGFILAPDTPLVDLIIQQGKGPRVIKAILEHLFSTKKHTWDILTCSQWPDDSPHWQLLQAILSQGPYAFRRGIASATPYIPIQGTWEAFLHTRSSKFRKTHRNITNRIHKLSKVELQCWQSDITSAVLQDIFSVSARSWKAQENIALASRDEVRLFFEMLTEYASQKGWLFVWVLKTDDQPIAIEYDLVWERCVYALRADFDEAYKEYSPGAYLEYHIIKSLFEGRYIEYSTGPGLRTYKLHWTEYCRENIMLDIHNFNTRGMLTYLLENNIVPFLRCMRDIKDRLVANYER